MARDRVTIHVSDRTKQLIQDYAAAKMMSEGEVIARACGLPATPTTREILARRAEERKAKRRRGGDARPAAV